MSGLRKCWAIAKKDITIYYLKGPVLIFGLLFPAFLFIAFAIGRDIPAWALAPGLVGMALFFTSSSVTPAVLPFETRTRTLERLLCAPLPLSLLVGGDVLAASMFGLLVSLVPITMTVTILGAQVEHVWLLCGAIILSTLCFAILGSLFSTPPTDNPSSVMTISNLVRLPLIFFSGVFVPIGDMSVYGQAVAAFSPLTYTTELLRYTLGQPAKFPPLLCLSMLLVFTLLFWFVNLALHRRNMSRRLWLT